jgi:Tfp pilus assembly protein PilV
MRWNGNGFLLTVRGAFFLVSNQICWAQHASSEAGRRGDHCKFFGKTRGWEK